MAGKIAKNTLFLTIAYIGQKIFSFVYFSLIARFIGVEKIGLYVTALSFSSLFSVFADLGLTQVLIREGARDKKNLDKILSQIIIVKLVLAVLAYLILNLLVFILGYAAELRQLIFISGILMVMDSLTLSFFGVLRALENLRYEATAVVGGQIIIVFFGLIVAWLRLPVVFLLLALGMGSLFNLLFSFSMVYKNGVKLRLIWDKALTLSIVKLSFAFALANIFSKVYSYIDSVLLSYLAGTKNVGFYSIPNKIVFAFQFIPMAFSASLYPAMSQFFVSEKNKLKYTFEKAFNYLMILAAPLAFGIYVIADVFINKVYGAEYAPSVITLRILVFGIIFAFLDFPVGALLNACNKQNIQTTVMGVTMVLNIILNIILIPVWGINGAAVAAVIGNFTLLFLGFLWIPQIIGRFNFGFWLKNTKIVLAAGLMGLFLTYFKRWFLGVLPPVGFIHTLIFLGLLIFLGALFYFLILWISGILTKKEVGEILGILGRKKYETGE